MLRVDLIRLGGTITQQVSGECKHRHKASYRLEVVAKSQKPPSELR